MCIQINKKIIEDEFDSQFDDYRDNDGEEKAEHINKELNKLPTHKKLRKLNLNDVMMDFFVICFCYVGWKFSIS